MAVTSISQRCLSQFEYAICSATYPDTVTNAFQLIAAARAMPARAANEAATRATFGARSPRAIGREAVREFSRSASASTTSFIR